MSVCTMTHVSTAVFVVSILLCAFGSGDVLYEETKLTPSDGFSDHWFGRSVSLSGDAALVGASGSLYGPYGHGSAYVYRKEADGWLEESKLLASDGAAEDKFGYAVALAGDTALIGAFGDDDNGSRSGSAYIFRKIETVWVEEVKLTTRDATANDLFGITVSLSGSVALIGAQWDDDNGTNAGAAYVFRHDGTGWVEETKLTASDGEAGDEFGGSVFLDGDTAIIGAVADDDNGSDAGAAYVYRYNGSSWVEESKLTADDGAAEDMFGCAVSVSGDAVLVGAQGDDDNEYGSGSAYIFRHDGSGWGQEAKLLASDGDNGDRFGRAVAIHDNVAMVGSPSAHDFGVNTGAAYVFRFSVTGWVEEQKLLASDPGYDDSFGFSLSLSADTAMVGAFGTAPKLGFACVFRHSVPGWYEEIKLRPSDNVLDLRFGRAVSLSADTALVGAPGERPSYAHTGSAYVFRREDGQWIREARLMAGDGEIDDQFGSSLSLDTNVALVGAYYNSEAGYRFGAAYVFRRSGSTWTEEVKLSATDVAEEDAFGYSVSLSGAAAIVGAPGDDDYGSGSGAAYVFRYDGANWVEEAKLTAADAAEGDGFGGAVFLDGDCAVIGALGDDDMGTRSGSAYIFRFNGSNWVEEAKLTAADGAAEDWFGGDVALHGDVALIGAVYDDENFENSGSAYVFRQNGTNWLEEAKLTASEPGHWEYFSRALAIHGDNVVVGAYGDENGIHAGSAYLYRFNGAQWVEKAKLLASDGAARDNLSSSIALEGDTALLGAYGVEDNGDDAGAAYIFSLAGTTSCSLICSPASGTLPFVCNMTVTLTNRYMLQKRRIAARMRVELANGQQWNNWRAGYTQLDPGQSYITAWNQNLPAYVTLLGENMFNLFAEDVTPVPYNQPPYPPAGDTGTASCTVTGIAP